MMFLKADLSFPPFFKKILIITYFNHHSPYFFKLSNQAPKENPIIKQPRIKKKYPINFP